MSATANLSPLDFAHPGPAPQHLPGDGGREPSLHAFPLGVLQDALRQVPVCLGLCCGVSWVRAGERRAPCPDGLDLFWP